MHYRLSLLGQPELSKDWERVVLTSRKGQALLYYLAANSGRSFSRAHLSSLLWCNSPSENARRNFNTMLTRFREEMPVWPILAIGNDLAWDVSAGVEVDVMEFDRRAPRRLSQDASRPQRAELRAAVELWRGVFCEGFACSSEVYEEWLAQERSLWESRVLAALEALVEREAAEDRWEDALELCRKALAVDGFRESFHRWTMTAHWERGERTRALAHYHAFSQMLERELGVAPEAATATLYERLVSQGALPVALGPAAPPTTPPDRVERSAPLGIVRQGGGSGTPFVGREGLVARILKALDSSEDGRVKFVLIHGEAGIGKSRLVDELLAAIGSQAIDAAAACVGAVVMGRCSPYGEDLPYAPLIEGISRVAESVDLDDLGLSEAVWSDLALVAPEIRERVPEANVERPQASPHERLRLFQAISRFLRALPRPVAVIVEDLHWVDTETLAALVYLASAPPDGKGGIAIIATSRSEELSPEFAEFAAHAEREGNWTRLDLAPLAARESRDLIAATWDDVKPDVAERIHAEAAGNPLYVLEIARYLREGGHLSRGESADDAERHFPVPPTVGRAVSGRMSGLEEQAKSLLQTASIFPGEVEFEPLASAAGLGEEDALRAHEALIAADFFRRDDGRGVSFVHDIVRRAVADTLSGPRRTAMHRRAYGALARAGETGVGAASAEDLAYHARAGELWREAVHWGQEAARAAERLFAYDAACRQLDRALAALDRLPAGPERAETERRVRAWRLRLEYWFNPHQAESQFDDSLASPGAGEGEPADELPDVLLARAEVLFMQGKVDAAEPMLKRAFELAGQGEAAIRGFALGGLGAVHIIRGNFAKAVELLEQAKPLVESEGRRFPGQSVTLAMASASALKGDFDRFATCLAELKRAPGDLSHMANLDGNKALVAYLQGRFEDAVPKALLGMERARSVDHRYNEYFCSIWLAAARVELGEIGRALADLAMCFELAQTAHTAILVDCVHAFHAMALLKHGRAADAADAARTGLRMAEERGFKLGRALCAEALGHVALADSDLDAARRLLAEAIYRLKAIDARPFIDLAFRRIPADFAQTLPNPSV